MTHGCVRRTNRSGLRKRNLRVRFPSKLSLHDADIEHVVPELPPDVFDQLSSAISHYAAEGAQDRPYDGTEADMDGSVRLERDPVCGMMVGERENQVEYRGVGYAFCSHQCRERFASTPGLYVGRRRLLAPKQKGMEVIKRRRMVLGVPITPAQFVELKGALLSMMGVKAVRAVETIRDGCRDPQRFESGTPMTPRIEAVEISYDLLQATAKQLERKFVEPIAALSNGWGQKLQRDFIHYLENCELDDLAICAAASGGRDGRTRHTLSRFKNSTRTQLGHGRRDLKG